MRIILLNGPPRCGKDTIGHHIWDIQQDRGERVYVTKFAAVLKERTHALYGLTDSAGAPRPFDAFEDCKDEPLGDFFGLTPRQAYIAVSERYMKALHGQEVWGDILLEELVRVERMGYTLAVITDSGFEPEAMPLVRHFGHQALRVFQIVRDGCTFEGDSRGYIQIPGVESFCIENNGTIDELRDLLKNWRG